MSLPLVGDITPHSSAEHAADWLPSIQHTPADVGEDWNKFKRSRSQCFAVKKKDFRERKKKKRKWSERCRSRQSAHRKEERVRKSWVWLITQATIFCEQQVKKPTCLFCHYLDNTCRNKAVWIQRNSTRRSLFLLTGFTAALFLNN